LKVDKDKEIEAADDNEMKVEDEFIIVVE